MSYVVREAIQKLEPYEPVLESYDVRLDANESFLNPGEMFSEEVWEALKNIPMNRYPDPSCRALRQAFGKRFGVDPELVVAGNGSDELLSLIIGCLVGPDEKYLTLAPDFSMYRIYGEIYGREALVLEKKKDLSIDAQAVIDKIKETGCRMVIFSNPCNPTSLVLKRADMLKIVENTDALVIADEAYMDFAGESVLDMAGKYDNLLVLRTCSKAFGLAAARLGFAVGAPALVKALNSVRSPYNVNAFSQALGTLILSKDEYTKDAPADLVSSRDELYKALKPLTFAGKIQKLYKSETNFVYAEVPNCAKLHRQLLERSISVRKMGSYLRITAGSPEENAKVLDALKEIFK
ncbi:MAG: histidinol-phosphate transaminase [Clostridiales bacterium]|nr:histidinol-phosphate transaminase [Clostridiales bacterium]